MPSPFPVFSLRATCPLPSSGRAPDLAPFPPGFRFPRQPLLRGLPPGLLPILTLPFLKSNRSTARPFDVRMSNGPRAGVKTEQGTPAPLRPWGFALLTPPLIRPVLSTAQGRAACAVR